MNASLSSLPVWVDALVAFLLVAGAFFAFVGSLGLAKLSSFEKRLHGPTKAATLGVGGVLLASIAIVATLTRRFLAPLPPAALPGTPATPGAATVPGAESLTRILSYLPYLTVLFAAFVPLAATIYLALTTLWSFVERLVLRRRMAG